MLIEQLNRNRSRKLTLVSAPAGYGKSTLVMQWLEGFGFPFAWLSLDAKDNDISRFLSYFVAAIQTLYPDACADCWRLLLSPELPDRPTLVASLVNDVLALGLSFIVVLDDYHVLHDEEVSKLIAELLERIPNNMHLVIASRKDPLLPLPRLRAGNQLVEMRAQTLRFTDDEAYKFFSSSAGLVIDVDTAVRMNRRIEGWVAGLVLAALAMNSPERSGSLPVSEGILTNEYVRDYLFSEVLASQTPTVQTFLLRASILDRFSVDLCHAILADGISGTALPLERGDLGRIVGELVNSNLFIMPLDDDGQWYRFHHLFQKILQQRLVKEVEETDIRAIHGRASNWLAESGFFEEALIHALAAGDMESAVAVVENDSRDLLNGLERRTLETWMDSLPPDVVWQRPKLLLAKAWLLYRHWRILSLEPILERILECLDGEESALEPDEERSLLGQVYTLRSASALYSNLDYERALAYSEQALKLLPSSELGSRFTATIHGALGQVGLGRSAIAARRFEAILGDPAPVELARAQTLIGINLIYLLVGDLVSMDSSVQKFLAFADADDLGLGASNWLAGLLFLEKNKLDKSIQHSAIMKQLRHGANFVGGFSAWYALVRVLQIQGGLTSAQAEIEELRMEVIRIGNRTFQEEVEALQAQQWYLAGDSTNAYRWAKSYQAHGNGRHLLAFDPPVLLWARILLATGSKEDMKWVQDQLVEQLKIYEETGFTRLKIQLLAHLAAVTANLDAHDRALHFLRKAIKMAEPGGAIRSFVDVGPSMMPMLVEIGKDGIAPAYVSELLAALTPHSWEQDENRIAVSDTDLLTGREEEILALMQASYTNQEIADELVLALSTVKRHASNIYMKLDVHTRRQAVQEAERLGFLKAVTVNSERH